MWLGKMSKHQKFCSERYCFVINCNWLSELRRLPIAIIEPEILAWFYYTREYNIPRQHYIFDQIISFFVWCEKKTHLDGLSEEWILIERFYWFVVSAGFGYRHVQVILLFSGLLFAYALRVNISVGIVAMVDKSTNSSHTVSIKLYEKWYPVEFGWIALELFGKKNVERLRCSWLEGILRSSVASPACTYMYGSAHFFNNILCFSASSIVLIDTRHMTGMINNNH